MDHAGAAPFAVVTGASSGIGYELARQFAEHGFDLLLIADDTGVRDAAAEFRGLGVAADTLQVDLASRAGVEATWSRVQRARRPLDAIALNAGVGVGGPFVDTDIDDEVNLIHLNVLAVVVLAKYAAREMAHRGAGRILFTSSVMARAPEPFLAVYAASKAFVQRFGEALRAELAGTGVTVTVLQPGPTETRFYERAGLEDTGVGQRPKGDPAEIARLGYEGLMRGKAIVSEAP